MKVVVRVGENIIQHERKQTKIDNLTIECQKRSDRYVRLRIEIRIFEKKFENSNYMIKNFRWDLKKRSIYMIFRIT